MPKTILAQINMSIKLVLQLFFLPDPTSDSWSQSWRDNIDGGYRETYSRAAKAATIVTWTWFQSVAQCRDSTRTEPKCKTELKKHTRVHDNKSFIIF